MKQYIYFVAFWCLISLTVCPLKSQGKDVQQLIKQLEDESRVVRVNAAEALGQLANPVAVPALVRTLGDPDRIVSGTAALALSRIGKPAVRALRIVLEDENGSIRRWAAYALALGLIGDDFTVMALVEVLDDTNVNVSHEVAGALAKIGKPAIPALIEVLNDGTLNARVRSAKALGLIRDPVAIGALIQALHDEGEEVLSHENSAVIKAATFALIEIGKPAVPGLVEALYNENDAVRHSAAHILKQIGFPARRAVLELAQAVKNNPQAFESRTEIQQLIQYFTSAQGQYDHARGLYGGQQYDQAKPILQRLVAESPNEIVSLFKYEEPYDTRFKVAPAALDMLGKIHLKEQNIPAAMNVFQSMIELGDTFFLGPNGGESLYGGPSEAEGILSQLIILMNKDELRDMIGNQEFSITPDYATAIELIHLLIKKYDGIVKVCSEFCPKYEEVAAVNLIFALEKMNSTLETWEREVRKIQTLTKNTALSAHLLLILGKKNAEHSDMAHAIEIYEEVIARYPDSYRLDEVAGFRVYALEAFEQKLHIYQTQKRTAEKLKQVRSQMRDHYQRIRQMLKGGEGYEMIKDRFEKQKTENGIIRQEPF